MMDVIRKNWLPLVIAVVVVAIIALVLLFMTNRDSGLPVVGDAPSFTLYNTEGEEVSLDNTQGKVRLIYFFFAHCPDVCLPTNHMLSSVQDGLKEAGVFGDEALILSVTFDPERDTAEYLREYMSTMNADTTGWHFLRDDDVEAVRDLALQYNVQVIPDTTQEGNFIHANLYTLIDKEGRIRKTYSPNEVIIINPENTGEFIEQIVNDMVALTK